MSPRVAAASPAGSAAALDAASSAGPPTVPSGGDAAAAARAAAARAAEIRESAASRASSRLDDQRLNQLHGALLAERRKLNQPGKISLEALGASLRETETKLKKQYAGKDIDFHVVVKDGKAVVKPIIG